MVPVNVAGRKNLVEKSVPWKMTSRPACLASQMTVTYCINPCYSSGSKTNKHHHQGTGFKTALNTPSFIQRKKKKKERRSNVKSTAYYLPLRIHIACFKYILQRCSSNISCYKYSSLIQHILHCHISCYKYALYLPNDVYEWTSVNGCGDHGIRHIDHHSSLFSPDCNRMVFVKLPNLFLISTFHISGIKRIHSSSLSQHLRKEPIILSQVFEYTVICSKGYTAQGRFHCYKHTFKLNLNFIRHTWCIWMWGFIGFLILTHTSSRKTFEKIAKFKLGISGQDVLVLYDRFLLSAQ